MKKLILGTTFLLVMVLMLAASVSLYAQQENPSATVPVRAVVTVLGKNFSEPPAVTRDDIQVYEGKDKLTVNEWAPAQGDRGALDFAIVVDDELNSDIGIQFNDIKDFIREMPPSTRVGLFYASNGTVTVAQDFTADHEAAAKALRLPFGRVAAYASDYLSINDLMKRWPSTTSRKEMLLVADGIDRFRGDIPESPDLEADIDRAQKTGFVIHTIYARGVGNAGRNFFRVNMGQSNLSRLADETGGEAFFQGTMTPVAYAPFLNELSTALKHQFWLTASAKPEKKGSLRRIRVRTELSGVEISAPENLYVPGPEGK
ncbi:MAG: hypothetical protein WAK91_17320 [Candidatus Acidiferrales bacterium]|jgi:hypothetical protein